MYQEHFQLKTQPFSEHAAATSLWVDSRMQEGLARLNYLADSATLGLVTGPSGCGKSALLKTFLARVVSAAVRTGLLPSHASQFDRAVEVVDLETGRSSETGQGTALRTNPAASRSQRKHAVVDHRRSSLAGRRGVDGLAVVGQFGGGHRSSAEAVTHRPGDVAIDSQAIAAWRLA